MLKSNMGISWGFTSDRFYIDIKSRSRPSLNFKNEIEQRALEIAESNSKLAVCLSSGLDSQLILFLFRKLGIEAEYYFLNTARNDIEVEQIKILKEKYSVKIHEIFIDVIKNKELVINLANNLDVHPINALQRLFVEQLPSNVAIVQGPDVPSIIYYKGSLCFVSGYYDIELSRKRIIDSIESRSAPFINYSNTSELLFSYLKEDLFLLFSKAWWYYENNNVVLKSRRGFKDEKLQPDSRYDYILKPLIYAKYWGDNLIYFPKLTGIEDISFINETIEDRKYKKHSIAIPISSLLNHLEHTDSRIKRFM